MEITSVEVWFVSSPRAMPFSMREFYGQWNFSSQIIPTKTEFITQVNWLPNQNCAVKIQWFFDAYLEPKLVQDFLEDVQKYLEQQYSLHWRLEQVEIVETAVPERQRIPKAYLYLTIGRYHRLLWRSNFRLVAFGRLWFLPYTETAYFEWLRYCLGAAPRDSSIAPNHGFAGSANIEASIMTFRTRLYCQPDLTDLAARAFAVGLQKLLRAGWTIQKLEFVYGNSSREIFMPKE